MGQPEHIGSIIERVMAKIAEAEGIKRPSPVLGKGATLEDFLKPGHSELEEEKQDATQGGRAL